MRHRPLAVAAACTFTLAASSAAGPVRDVSVFARVAAETTITASVFDGSGAGDFEFFEQDSAEASSFDGFPIEAAAAPAFEVGGFSFNGESATPFGRGDATLAVERSEGGVSARGSISGEVGGLPFPNGFVSSDGFATTTFVYTFEIDRPVTVSFDAVRQDEFQARADLETFLREVETGREVFRLKPVDLRLENALDTSFREAVLAPGVYGFEYRASAPVREFPVETRRPVDTNFTLLFEEVATPTPIVTVHALTPPARASAA